jgi:hypothetical protein
MRTEGGGMRSPKSRDEVRGMRDEEPEEQG